MLEYAKGMLHNYVRNEKIYIFHQHFFDMDIPLIMPLTSLKSSVHVDKTHLEGSVSQIFDIDVQKIKVNKSL